VACGYVGDFEGVDLDAGHGTPSFAQFAAAGLADLVTITVAHKYYPVV